MAVPNINNKEYLENESIAVDGLVMIKPELPNETDSDMQSQNDLAMLQTVSFTNAQNDIKNIANVRNSVFSLSDSVIESSQDINQTGSSTVKDIIDKLKT